jgi:hypothetical protein
MGGRHQQVMISYCGTPWVRINADTLQATGQQALRMQPTRSTIRGGECLFNRQTASGDRMQSNYSLQNANAVCRNAMHSTHDCTIKTSSFCEAQT